MYEDRNALRGKEWSKGRSDKSERRTSEHYSIRDELRQYSRIVTGGQEVGGSNPLSPTTKSTPGPVREHRPLCFPAPCMHMKTSASERVVTFGPARRRGDRRPRRASCGRCSTGSPGSGASWRSEERRVGKECR